MRQGSRRRYKICSECHIVVIVAGKPLKGDRHCVHSRPPRELITPTVYFENAKGEIWSGPDAATPCPLAGYQRREVQAHEIRRFERLMNRKMQDEQRAQLERQREASEFHARHREQTRRELDAEILKEAEHWDAEHKEFLHYAMAHRDDPVYTRNFDPEFHVGSFS